jgi:glycosyltransferase involved in cell wall biosynthesis
MKALTLVYIVNADWYFNLHWIERAKASLMSGYVVHVFTPKTCVEELERIQSVGLSYTVININRKGLNPLAELFAFIQIFIKLRRLDPDLIHTITIKPNLYGVLAGNILRKPVISSVTGLGLVFSSTSLKSKFLRVFIKPFFRMISSASGNKLIFENREDLSYMVSEKMVAIGNTSLIIGAGVNPSLFVPSGSSQGNPVKILFAARMLRDKGIEDLISATKILRKQKVNFELIVAGIIDSYSSNAISKSEIEQWHNNGLIRWLENCRDMPKLLASVNIVVLPTTYGEGVPRILIEAASCGLPIVATNIAGCREIVHDGVNGFLVPPNNPEAIRVSLENLIKDACLRSRMGKAGRLMVLKTFSEKMVIEKTLNVYKNLLDSLI